MRERDQQPGFGEFAPRKLFDSRRWIELELPAQLLRVGSVPFRVEGARVTDEFIHSHPAGQIPVLRKKAHATEHRDRLRNRIEIKHAQGTRFRLEQAEDVFDERGFARAVGAHQPEHLSALDVEADAVERQFRFESAGKIADGNDWLVRRRSRYVHIHGKIRGVWR